MHDKIKLANAIQEGTLTMPFIECLLIEGYDRDTRRVISERLTDAACSATGAAPEFVIVTIKEVETDNYMRGRTQKTPAKAPPQAESIVRSFLTSMENRKIEEAQQYLAESFVMRFPGGASFTELGQLVDWAKQRYQRISKTFDNFDVSFNGLDSVVHCSGTLKGTWLDGQTFDDIRFCDRFTLSGSKITSQNVWNDMAEAKR